MKVSRLFSFFLLFLLTNFYPTEAIEGFYKDVFQDEGTQISGGDLEIDCEYIGFTQEHLNTSSDETGQAAIMIQNPNDENGYLLYPDGEPRFAIIYYHGGFMGHATDLGAAGKQRIRDHYYHGGSQFGSSAGSYMLCSSSSTYFEIWPGRMNGPNVSSTNVDKIINAGSPFIGYFNYTAGSTITSIYHNNGGSIDTTDMPAGTKICAMHNSGTLKGYGAIWSWKDNDTTGVVLGHTGHPEGVSAEEKKQYICASMLYLRDGLGTPDIKGELDYNVERIMNKSTSDNDPLYTKIGDKQYHHFIIIFGRPTNNVKITLDGEDGYDFHLFAAKDTFAFNYSADYLDSTSGSDKVLAIAEEVPACTLYVGVKLNTTVNTTSGDIFPDYSGELEVLNGLAYSIKYDTINTTDTVSVISPNGGEQWERGTENTISWNTSLTGNVKIELLKNNLLHSTIAASISSTGPFSWTIPDTISYGPDYLIRISGVIYPNVNDQSDENFTIYKSPTVTSLFPDDTVIATGKEISIAGSATGAPTPAYEWFFIHPVSQTPVPKGNNATLTLANAAKSDSGYYYFVADNGYGTVSSDTVFIHVLDPVTITLDLPSTYTAVQNGSAVFSIGVEREGTFSYQWYQNDFIMTDETGSSLTITSIDSATHHGNTYYCIVSNSHLGMLVGSATSTTSTLVVSKYYNPFKVKAERISMANTTQVRVKLWSEVDISNFPTEDSSPLEVHAQYVGVIYKTNGYATDTSEATIAKYSPELIKEKAAASDSLIDTLTVGTLPYPNDSCFWFNYTVCWIDPAGPDILLKPFMQANKVFMYDTIAPENPLEIHGEYFDRTDSAMLVIGNISLLNAAMDSVVVIQCSRFPGFNPLLFDVAIPVPELITGGNSDTVIVHNLGSLPIETSLAYCRWYVVGKNKNSSAEKNSDFEIGWDRPVYTGTLLADSTFFGDKMHLSWDAPVRGADSIRIWWDTDTIPLEHSIALPFDQAYYTELPTITVDTVSGLTNNTQYFFGLQIFRDDMWSCVTVQSRTSAKTALGNQELVGNIIALDSAWFNNITNKALVKWHIDLSGLTQGRSYESGYSYSLDTSYLTKTPSKWDSVPQAVNITEIVLGTGLVFDTIYNVGLWLRGVSDSLGPGQPAAPTDSSIVSVRSPAFTWQTITTSPDKLDTVYAMGGNIIIQTITPFNLSDTLRIYNRPDSLPGGICDVGGTAFYFSNANQQTPPFRLGMRYNLQKYGITKENISIFNDINGPLYNIYGCEVGDSIAWVTVTSLNIIYPFMVLADTLPPSITFESLNADTSGFLNVGDAAPMEFTIRDNIANVKWEFMYGKGDRVYENETEGELSSTIDTISELMYVLSGYENYGLRAQINVSDGIFTKSINVSRRVAIVNSDAFLIPSLEWVPLRATASLIDSTLATVLDTFTNSQGQLVYDKTKLRLARWYDPTGGSNCGIIEYSELYNDHFSLIPGRIVWLKTAEPLAVNSGEGVATSLKDTFEIVLQGKMWTDFALPFKFPVKIKDILAATGAEKDSLVFYRWVKSDSTYTAVSVYIPSLDSTTKKDTAALYYKPLHDAYTVYSRSPNPIVLRIPPIPPALSPDDTSRFNKLAQKEQNIWDISLLWKKEKSSFVNRVRCGCDNSNSGKPVFGSLAPSFGKVAVGVTDGKKQVGGYAVYHSLNDGGLTYEIALYNQSDKAETIEYSLGNCTNLPEGYKACIYNPVTAKYEEGEDGNGTIIMKGKSSDRRWVVIGTDSYLDNFLKNNYVSNFALLGVYPNPFRGRINIRYAIPWYGVKKINFRIYDLRGRTVWKKTLSSGIKRGVNTVAWGMSGNSGQRLASGVYLFRMTVYENGKKSPKVFKRKLTCLR